MTVIINGDPTSLNPVISFTSQNYYVANQLYDRLINYNKNFQPIPDLAANWTISSNYETFTFHLVQNATWTDGVPVTSTDVKNTVTCVAPQLDYEYPTIMKGLVSVETPDPYTVVFNFNTPKPYLLEYLGEGAWDILPAHVFTSCNVSDIKSNPANTDPTVTDGPFKFQSWVRGQSVTLVRNPNYFHKYIPYLNSITFLEISDPSTIYNLLTTGQAQEALGSLPTSDYPLLKNDPSITVYNPTVLGRVVELWFNLNRTVFKNPEVRQAIAYALNRTAIASTVGFGLGKVAVSPIGSGVPNYFDPNVPQYNYNLTKANSLLDQAGYPRQANGTRFTVDLRVVASITSYEQIAELVKAQLANVGINVNVIASDAPTTYTAIFTNHNFDMAIYSTTSGPEPAITEVAAFDSDFIGKGFFTDTSYVNPTVNSLFTEALTETNIQTRIQDYFKIQSILMTDLPMIPIWEPAFPSAANNAYVNALNFPDDRYATLADVWWTGGTPITVSTSPTSSPSTTSSFYSYIAAAVVVVVVVVITGLYVYIRHRPKVA
jgi:peptide/nickel transport system substrate-binding protein